MESVQIESSDESRAADVSLPVVPLSKSVNAGEEVSAFPVGVLSLPPTRASAFAFAGCT